MEVQKSGFRAGTCLIFPDKGTILRELFQNVFPGGINMTQRLPFIISSAKNRSGAVSSAFRKGASCFRSASSRRNGLRPLLTETRQSKSAKKRLLIYHG